MDIFLSVHLHEEYRESLDILNFFSPGPSFNTHGARKRLHRRCPLTVAQGRGCFVKGERNYRPKQNVKASQNADRQLPFSSKGQYGSYPGTFRNVQWTETLPTRTLHDGITRPYLHACWLQTLKRRVTCSGIPCGCQALTQQTTYNM